MPFGAVEIWNTSYFPGVDASGNMLSAGLVIVLSLAVFLLALTVSGVFERFWNALGKAKEVVKSVIVGIAVFYAGKGLYIAGNWFAGEFTITLGDVFWMAVKLCVFGVIGHISIKVYKRIRENYEAIKSKEVVGQDEKAGNKTVEEVE